MASLTRPSAPLQCSFDTFSPWLAISASSRSMCPAMPCGAAVSNIFSLQLVALGAIFFSALAIWSLADHRSLSPWIQRFDRLEILDTGYSGLGAETHRVVGSGGLCSEHAVRTTPT